eukprot:Selendium_serpulae@DN5144_c1_g1_i1.p1
MGMGRDGVIGSSSSDNYGKSDDQTHPKKKIGTTPDGRGMVVVSPDCSVKSNCFIEFKLSRGFEAHWWQTNRGGQLARPATNLRRHKFTKWWLQSHLAGVPNIFVGWRDDDGGIRDFELLKTESLPGHFGEFCSAGGILQFVNDVLMYFRDALLREPQSLEKGVDVIFNYNAGSDSIQLIHLDQLKSEMVTDRTPGALIKAV